MTGTKDHLELVRKLLEVKALQKHYHDEPQAPP